MLKFAAERTNNIIMDRKEAFRLVKELNLQDEIKEIFGKNYTLVTTANLEEVINSCRDEEEDDEEEDDYNEHNQASFNFNPEDLAGETENPYEAACMALVGILKDTGRLNVILDKLK